MLRRVKFRDAALLLEEFPFFTDVPVRLRFLSPRAVQHFPILCNLRCCEQLVEAEGDVNAYEIYVEKRAFAGELRKELPLGFELPAGAPTTRLRGDVRAFYELDITADTPGGSYRGLFLLPTGLCPATVSRGTCNGHDRRDRPESR